MIPLRETRLFKIAGLLTGFALGQGSMFLAQTWLVANSQLIAVGEIGLGLAIVSLAQWTADWGGTLLLSRHAAIDETVGYVRAAIAVRLSLAGPIIAAVLIFCVVYEETQFVQGMVWGGAASALIWAFNLTGYLDGKGKSAISGPISSLSWLAASIGLVLLPSGQSFTAGLTIGVLYTAGVAITVVIQYIISARIGCPVALAVPNWEHMRRFAVDGALYCSADLPGQIYGRCLILIVMTFLGSEMAGIYVYIRHVVVAATQAISFMMRVEFPAIARCVSAGKATVGTVLRIHNWSIAASVGICLLLIALSISTQYGPSNAFVPIFQQLRSFSVIIPALVVSAVLGQAIIAYGAMPYYTVTMFGSMAASLFFILLLISSMGLQIIAMSEVIMHTAQATFFSLFQAKLWAAQDSLLRRG
jgi:hypothetical protein